MATRNEFIERMADKTGITREDAKKALKVFVGEVKDRLRKDEKVTLTGFGTFSVAKKTERVGRNPRTGEEIKIPARKIPKFSAGRTFKAALRKK
jgi:DNA-binding protein HU-beta